jgi:hypothetical protein
MEFEFDGLGHDFHARGARLDEQMELLRDRRERRAGGEAYLSTYARNDMLAPPAGRVRSCCLRSRHDSVLALSAAIAADAMVTAAWFEEMATMPHSP